MDQGGVTWIVAADARQARIFAERIRGREVIELPARRTRADEGDQPGGHSHHGTVHERAGQGRHGAGERDAARETERRFLKRLASQLAEAARGGEFDSLALMAPPRALGILRGALPPVIVAKIEVCDPHQRRDDGPAEIRLHLRQARARVPA